MFPARHSPARSSAPWCRPNRPVEQTPTGRRRLVGVARDDLAQIAIAHGEFQAGAGFQLTDVGAGTAPARGNRAATSAGWMRRRAVARSLRRLSSTSTRRLRRSTFTRSPVWRIARLPPAAIRAMRSGSTGCPKCRSGGRRPCRAACRIPRLHQGGGRRHVHHLGRPGIARPGPRRAPPACSVSSICERGIVDAARGNPPGRRKR